MFDYTKKALPEIKEDIVKPEKIKEAERLEREAAALRSEYYSSQIVPLILKLTDVKNILLEIPGTWDIQMNIEEVIDKIKNLLPNERF